jgi:hypothetical protein
VAERYRHGRIFLARDAAREMPTGSFGLNTGVQDVHNLAWKLAPSSRGVAGASLLDTYHDERQPIGRAITEQSLNNSASMGRLGGQASGTAIARPEYLNEQGMIFGAAYTSAAVVPDGTAAPVVANAVTDYVPSGRPGGRAPHVWLERDGARISTIDLVGNGFVLLTGSRGNAWKQAAQRWRRNRSRHQCAQHWRCRDQGPRWAVVDHLVSMPTAPVLLRPDGYVAWRGPSLAPEPTLRAALAGILGRPL